ncbi:MAG TPA: cysteine desulfurase [Actinomycetota bacterium]|nr:cysteine desulfurase [Actinomycetota bacterium]
MDAAAIRKDFPVLDQEVNGHPLVYLDNAATSQRPRAVLNELTRFYEQDNSNVHRSVHTLGQRATVLYEGAREKVAELIGAGSERGVIFTKSATEGLNLIAYAWARHHLGPGDEVLVTEMEHHSNLVSWQLACRDTGATLRAIPVNDEATLDLSELPNLLSTKTRIVAVGLVSNVLGTINPIEQITAKAHEVGALVVCDGAQATPHMPVDVQALGCDFYVGTGHKMCAPTGIGFVWGREEILEDMEPFHGGGEMILDVWIDHATFNEIPYKFEAGTPPIAQAVGLGAAIDYLNEIGMKAIRDHEVELTKYALDQLNEVPEIKIYGPKNAEEKGGVVSLTLGDIHAHDVGTICDSLGVAVRAGHHCAKPLMRKLGIPATTRASFYIYNTHEDVDRLVDALKHCQEVFSGGGGLPL